MAYEDIDSTDGSLSVHAIYRLADRLSNRLVRKKVTMQDYCIYGGVAEYEKKLSKIQEKAAYFQKKCEGLEAENRELTQIVEDTERQKLLREIEDLKEKLYKARQRENVAVQQRKDAEREARIAKSQVWDDFKPTKEQVKAFYKVIRICMDCETDY